MKKVIKTLVLTAGLAFLPLITGCKNTDRPQPQPAPIHEPQSEVADEKPEPTSQGQLLARNTGLEADEVPVETPIDSKLGNQYVALVSIGGDQPTVTAVAVGVYQVPHYFTYNETGEMDVDYPGVLPEGTDPFWVASMKFQSNLSHAIRKCNTDNRWAKVALVVPRQGYIVADYGKSRANWAKNFNQKLRLGQYLRNYHKGQAYLAGRGAYKAPKLRADFLTGAYPDNEPSDSAGDSVIVKVECTDDSGYF